MQPLKKLKIVALSRISYTFCRNAHGSCRKIVAAISLARNVKGGGGGGGLHPCESTSLVAVSVTLRHGCDIPRTKIIASDILFSHAML